MPGKVVVYKPRNRRRRHRRNNQLATRPRMMTRYNRNLRWNNVSSKIFYLRDSGTIFSDFDGRAKEVWSVRDLPAATQQFLSCAQLYDQYKVLGMTVRLFPANVGIEPHDELITTDFTLFRGNAAVWSDQRPGDAVQIPNNINDVINYGSCRIIQPRRYYKRTIYRAKGFPDWGGIEANQDADQWRGTITLLQTNATPDPGGGGAAPTLWYWSRTFKVVFRGRRQ